VVGPAGAQIPPEVTFTSIRDYPVDHRDHAGGHPGGCIHSAGHRIGGRLR
jgi:hypothetical protein